MKNQLFKRAIVIMLALSMLITSSGLAAFAESLNEEAVSGADAVAEEQAHETGEADATAEEAVSADNKAEETAEAAADKADEQAETKADAAEQQLTAKDWEANLPARVSDDAREAMAQVAQSQDGSDVALYKAFANAESISRGDASFVMFVIEYAGVLGIRDAIKDDSKGTVVNGDISVPVDADTDAWIKALKQAGLYNEVSEDSMPQQGDIVFASGMAAVVTEAADGSFVLLGQKDASNSAVKEYSAEVKDIDGFVSLKAVAPERFTAEGLAEAVAEAAEAGEAVAEDAQKVDAADEEITEAAEGEDAVNGETAEDAEKAAEDAKAEEEAARAAKAEAEGLKEQTIEATITSAPGAIAKLKAFGRKLAGTEKATEITLTGLMPENAIVKAYPVNVEIPGQNVLTAYDITIYTTDEDGNETVWQPGEALSVSIKDNKLTNAEDASALNVYHMENKDAVAKPVAEVANDSGQVTFDAESFSVYAVTASLQNIITTTDGKTYKITVRYDDAAKIPEDAELRVNEVNAADYLSETKAVLDQNRVKIVRALDISIITDHEGKITEIQPSKAVYVSIELIGQEDLGNTQIVHFGDKSTDVIDPSIKMNGDTLELGFATDGFSIYEVVDVTDSEIYTFQNEDGSVYDQQIICAGDNLAKPSVPVVENKTFIGWFVVDNGTVTETEFTNFGKKETITKDKEYILRAKYDSSVYITYYDQNGNVMRMDKADDVKLTEADVEEGHDGDIGKVDPDRVGYSPIDKNGVSYEFLGWSETEGQTNTAHKKGLIDPETEGSISLYPILVAGQWIYYHSGAIGSGATYTPPTFVRATQTPSAPENPTRAGYTFDGWWTAESGGTQVFDSTGTLVSSAHRRLTAPLDLYAHWAPLETASYTVILWRQKLNEAGDNVAGTAEKDYAYAESFTIENQRTDQDITLNAAYQSLETVSGYNYLNTAHAGINSARVDGVNIANNNSSNMENNPYYGFKYARVEYANSFPGQANDTIRISPDSKTVLNVYYNRGVFNLNFYQEDGRTSVNSYSKPYGVKLDDVFPVKTSGTDNEYQNNNNQARWEDFSNPVLYNTVVAKLPSMPGQNMKFKYDGDGSGANQVTYHYMAEAIGSPSDTQTFDGKEYVEFYSFKARYRGLFKDDDVTPFEGKEYSFEGVIIENTTKRINGDSGWTVDSNGTYFKTKNNAHYYILYTRQSKDLQLKYGVGTGNLQGNLVKTPAAKYKYETEISVNTLADVNETVESKVPAGYEFTGWYSDAACTVPVFEKDSEGVMRGDSFKMPANNVVLYAKFAKKYYRITLDPTYGELPTGASMWFWKQYDDTFDEYTPTRNYVKDDDGTYSYVMYEFDPDDIDDIAQRPRTASYYPTTDVPDVPQEDIDDGITTVESGFRAEANAYSFAGWYLQDPVTGDLSKRAYQFGTPVHSNLHLVAKWQPLIVYNLKYELKDENGNDLTDIGGVSAPTDDASYVNASRAQVMDLVNSDKLPRGKQFQGWKIKGNGGAIYQPNESVPITDDYAVKKVDPDSGEVTREITLIPVITEEEVSNQTRGTYYFMNQDSDGNWQTFYEEIVYAGETLTSPPATPEYNGTSTGETPQFEGWYEDATLDHRFEGFGTISNPRDTYLYASFEKQFHVTYHAASADGNSDQILSVQSYPPSGTTVLNTTGIGTSYVYSSNYNLCGWTENEQLALGTTSAAGVTVYPFNEDTTGTPGQKFVTGDMDLYPVMESGHTLSFDTLGGNPIPSKFYPTSENTVAPADPAKGDGDQFEFKGWYKDRDYDEEFEFGTTLSKSQMIYAKWEDKYAPSTAKVTVAYWIQGEDGTSYSIPENGKVEETVQPKSTYELAAGTRNSKLNDLVGENAPYYELDKITDKNGDALTQDGSGNVGVEATVDNGTVINVYYKLKRFNLTFNAGAGTLTPPSTDTDKVEFDANTGVYTIKNAYLGMNLSEVWPDASSVTPPDGKVFNAWKQGSNSFNGNDTVSADMLGDGNETTLTFTADYVNKATPTNGDNPGELDVLNNASDPAGNYFEVIVNHHLRNTADGEDIGVVQKRQVVNLTNYKKLVANNATGETDRANLKDSSIFPSATYDHLLKQTSNSDKTFTDTTSTKAYTLYSYTKKYAFFTGRRNAINPLRYNYDGENGYSLESIPNKTRGTFRILNGSTEISDSTWVYMNTAAGGGIGSILSDTYHKSDDISATYATIKSDYLTYFNESTQSGTTYTPGTVTIDIVYVEPPAQNEHTLNLVVQTGTNGDTYSETVYTGTFAAGADISATLGAQKPSDTQMQLLVPEGKNTNDYEFKGWSMNSDNTLAAYAESTMPASDLTLYAVVLPKTVSVTTLVKDYAAETRSRDKGTEFGGFDIPVPDTNDDEVFVGWKDTATNEYWDNDDQVREDITVRAVIVSNDQVYHIYYDLNGGSPKVGKTPVAGTERQTSGEYEDSQSGTEQANDRWMDPTDYSPGATIPVKAIASGTVEPPKGYEQFIYWKDSRGNTYHVNDLITIPMDGNITLYAQYARVLETTLVYQLNNGSTGTDKDITFKDYRDTSRKPDELITNATYPVGTYYVPGATEDAVGTYELWTWGNGDDAKTVMLMNPGYHFTGWLDSTKQAAYDSADEQGKASMLLQNRQNIRVTAPDLDENGEAIVNYLVAQWEQDKLPVKAYKVPQTGDPVEISGSAGNMTTTEVSTWTSAEFETAYKSSQKYTVDDGYTFHNAKVGDTVVTDIKYDAKSDGSGYAWMYKGENASTFTEFGTDDVLTLYYSAVCALTINTEIDMTGEYSVETDEFEVTVTLKKADDSAPSTDEIAAITKQSKINDSGTMSTAAAISEGTVKFTLGNGGSAVISNIPNGWKYSIAVTDTKSYTVTYNPADSDNGTLSENTSVDMSFKRTSDAIVPSGIAGHDNMLMLIMLVFVLTTAELYIVIRRRRKGDAYGKH